jgi:ABC-type sugar transport system ATPase subunit
MVQEEVSLRAPVDLADRSQPILQAVGITKRFGHVTALEDFDISLYPAEICALVGDNGAGKSTLVSILSGVRRPDAGTIRIDGVETKLESPHHAHSLGITTVFQDLALVERRDVAANLFLGQERCRFGVVLDRRRMIREATRVIVELQVALPSVRTHVAELSGGQRQAVAVARSLIRGGGRITLLDEPTAALGVREAERVFDLIVRLRKRGVSVLYISHNLENVFRLADRIVVARHGRKLADQPTASTSREEVVSLLVAGKFG